MKSAWHGSTAASAASITLPNERVAEARANGFEATTMLQDQARADALIVCVPTPLNRHREPDLSYIQETAEAIAPHLRAGQLVSLESTTFPGTTEEIMAPRLEVSGLKAGEDFFLVYSPEREDPGNQKFPTHMIPKVCGGLTATAWLPGWRSMAWRSRTSCSVSSPRAAEMTKLLENIHRVVNIGLVNEMKIIATPHGHRHP